MNSRPISSIAHAFALALFCLCLPAAHAGDLPLRVERAWIQAVPPAASATAIYMRLINTGKTPLRLVGGETPIASTVHPMITTQTGGNGHAMAGMEDAPALEIPPGGTLVLQPGGNHLMVMELKQHPKPGETVPFTVAIEPGGQRLKLNLPALLTAPK